MVLFHYLGFSTTVRSMVTQPYHVMLKPRGAICDLDCEYCYYLKKEELYTGSSFRMTDDVLEAFTKQYIESQYSPEIVFGWQGGEPTLMGLDFYRRAVEYQRKYAKPGVAYNVLTTVHAANVDHPLEVYRYLRDEVGSLYMQFIPIVEPEGEAGLNYLCEGYRAFFNHINPAMKYMVQALRHRAPPAGIMRVLADGVDL